MPICRLTSPCLLVLVPVLAHAQPVTGGGVADPFGREPRFMVELESLTVRDETGFDWLGSDEVIVVIEADGLFAQGPTFGDLDDGDTRETPSGNRCAWPAEDTGERDGVWSCRPAGAPGPATITFSLYEKDGMAGAAWDAFVRWEFGFCVAGGADLRSADCLANEEIEQEVNPVGRYRVVYTREDLVTALPASGSGRTESVRVDTCSEATTVRGEVCGTGWPAESWVGVYDLNLRITRLSDVIIEPPLDPEP